MPTALGWLGVRFSPSQSYKYISEMEETKNGKVLVRFRQFPHQVGGHYTMMQLDDETVCKPLNKTEHRFYERVPRELQQFVPRYEGKASKLPFSRQDAKKGVFFESDGDRSGLSVHCRYL